MEPLSSPATQYIYGFHLRSALPFPHGLPHRFPEDPRHEPRGRRPAVFRNGLWDDFRWSLHSLHPTLLRPKTGSQQQRKHTGVATPSGHHRWCFIHSRSFLVRMVRIQSRHPLDRSHTLWPTHWVRTAVDIPPIVELSRRRLSHVVSLLPLPLYPSPSPLHPSPLIPPCTNRMPHQRRLRHRRKHLPPFHRRRPFPPVLNVHVRRPGGRVGRHAPRLCGADPRSDPGRVLEVWRQDKGEE